VITGAYYFMSRIFLIFSDHSGENITLITHGMFSVCLEVEKKNGHRAGMSHCKKCNFLRANKTDHFFLYHIGVLLIIVYQELIMIFHPQVTMLINNAGIVFGKTLLELPDQEIDTTFQVNILAHYWVRCLFITLF